MSMGSKKYFQFLSPFSVIINFPQTEYLNINVNKEHSDNIFNKT